MGNCYGKRKTINDEVKFDLNKDKQKLKIVLIGDSNVGKTSIVAKYIRDSFNSEEFPTIGTEFSVKNYLKTYTSKNGKISRNVNYKLHIWDTAGQERFRTLTNLYYRGCDAIILCYDVNYRPSFENIKLVWIKEILKYFDIDHKYEIEAGEMIKPAIILVGNKTDLGERTVFTDDGSSLAEKHGFLFAETSCMDSESINGCFDKLVEEMIKLK